MRQAKSTMCSSMEQKKCKYLPFKIFHKKNSTLRYSSGAIKPEDMFFYLKHKDSYVHKYVKRAGYEDAVKQIEEAISKAGGDGNSTAGPQNEEPTLGSDVSVLSTSETNFT